MKEIRYTYKPNITVFLLRIIFFAVSSLCLGYMARTNDDGLIIKPIIELPVNDVTIFYYCLAIGSAIFVIFSLIGLIEGVSKGLISDLSSNNEIVLAKSSMSLPKINKSNEITTLNYSEIIFVDILEENKQQFFNIYCADERLTISQNFLPNRESFYQLVNFIAMKVNSLPIKHYKNGSEYVLHFTI